MNKMSARNVSIITDNALCTACGACAGICPKGAVNMRFNAAGFLRANVDLKKCISCGMCLNICPSNGERADNDFIGTTINGYIGYAKDENLRAECQSGGIVTAVLLYLLNKNLIDAVVVTRFNCQSRRSESFLTTTSEEIIGSKGSHYSQTSPVEIILKNQDKRLAAVLLGCQSDALNQIKKKYPNIKLPEYIIGLVCAGNLSSYMIDDLLSHGKIKKDDKLQSFRFRDKKCGGWPGNITIKTDKLIQLPKEKRMELKPYYQNYRCLLCADKMNLNCDLVVGDPWGIKIEDEEKGYSAVITRTDIGEKLINDAQASDYIQVTEQSVKSIVEGQQIENELITRHIAARQICNSKRWMFPYSDLETSSDKEEIKCNSILYEKLEYSHMLQYCKNTTEAKRMIKRYKKKNSHPIKELLYSIKKKYLVKN